jgi:hypothetical protein
MMDFDPETELLLAVAESVKTLYPVTVDLEDNVPSMASQTHVIVSPSSYAAGPRNRLAAQVSDLLIGCRVIVFERIAEVPRDRRGSVFASRSGGLNLILAKIRELIEFNYTLMTQANAAMGLSMGSGYVEPLRYVSHDSKPVGVLASAYDAYSQPTSGSHPMVAMKRGINFSSARFLLHRT